MSLLHEEVGTEGRRVARKGVGSNSSSLLMSEGLFCSMGVNPHGHLQVLLLRGRETQLLAPSCVLGIWVWGVSSIRVCLERREETWINVHCCRFAVRRRACWLRLLTYPCLIHCSLWEPDLLFPGFKAQLAGVSMLTGPLWCLCCW